VAQCIVTWYSFNVKGKIGHWWFSHTKIGTCWQTRYSSQWARYVRYVKFLIWSVFSGINSVGEDYRIQHVVARICFEKVGSTVLEWNRIVSYISNIILKFNNMLRSIFLAVYIYLYYRIWMCKEVTATVLRGTFSILSYLHDCYLQALCFLIRNFEPKIDQSHSA